MSGECRPHPQARPGGTLMQQSRSGSSAVGPQNCVWDQRSGVLLLAALLLCHSVLADGGLPGYTQSVAATETFMGLW